MEPAVYNGADYGNYRWSQTHSDIDVQIPVPTGVRASDDVRVDVSRDRVVVLVRAEGQEPDLDLDLRHPQLHGDQDGDQGSFRSAESATWRTILDDRLRWPVRAQESVWTLLPDQHIHVQLEKVTPRWWEALLEGEPDLDTTAMDKTKPLDELPSDEQMKVQELMWREAQKKRREAGRSGSGSGSRRPDPDPRPDPS